MNKLNKILELKDFHSFKILFERIKKEKMNLLKIIIEIDHFPDKYLEYNKHIAKFNLIEYLILFMPKKFINFVDQQLIIKINKPIELIHKTYNYFIPRYVNIAYINTTEVMYIYKMIKYITFKNYIPLNNIYTVEFNIKIFLMIQNKLLKKYKRHIRKTLLKLYYLKFIKYSMFDKNLLNIISKYLN